MADRETSAVVSDRVGVITGEAGDGGDDGDRDRVDEQEDESFPASDPHSDWAGGPPEPGGD